ncbi:MAG: WecB/TagA/CpsF family glycosyltransferase [Ruminococcaceae bacterium]|nr:WecB/TagA/CpsF family glycosyltransferase [Oscillospiraceae bacterium]
MVWETIAARREQRRQKKEKTSTCRGESLPVVRVLDIPYFDGDMENAVNRVLPFIKSRSPFAVFTPGATVAARAAKEPTLAALLKTADMILPDGCGCLLAARLCGKRLKERIAGIDFAEKLFREAEKISARVFLYGAKEGVAERAAVRLRGKYPSLIFASACGYGEDPWERIAAFCPHVVCVCLGAGKQEAWIAEHKEKVGGVMMGLGGSLDVWAGEVRRAPRAFQRMGLEWAYRTVREPKRIVRLFTVPRYLLACALSRRSSKCQNKKKNKGNDGKM